MGIFRQNYRTIALLFCPKLFIFMWTFILYDWYYLMENTICIEGWIPPSLEVLIKRVINKIRFEWRCIQYRLLLIVNLLAKAIATTSQREMVSSFHSTNHTAMGHHPHPLRWRNSAFDNIVLLGALGCHTQLFWHELLNW